MRRLSKLSLAGVALSLALAGCNKESAPVATTPVESAPPPAAPPVPAGKLEVESVVLGTVAKAEDKTVTAPATTFKPSDTIYASVRTVGSTPSATVKGRWTFKGEKGDILVDEREQRLSSQGAESTLFQIAKPDGFPAGTYGFEVFVNGASVRQTRFTVAAAGGVAGAQ